MLGVGYADLIKLIVMLNRNLPSVVTSSQHCRAEKFSLFRCWSNNEVDINRRKTFNYIREPHKNVRLNEITKAGSFYIL